MAASCTLDLGLEHRVRCRGSLQRTVQYSMAHLKRMSTRVQDAQIRKELILIISINRGKYLQVREATLQASFFFISSCEEA